MRHAAYPSSDAAKGAHARTILGRLLARNESRKILRRLKRRADETVEMTLLSGEEPRPLDVSDVPLVFLCHNDRKFLPSLVSHYRRLGVTRFICVDDQSTDGSRDYLSAQPDVDLWVSPVRYKEARRGKLWREGLFARYGSGRWYLNIDADEYLVYDDCFSRPIGELIRHLETVGLKRLAAPMVDLYPGGAVNAFVFDGSDARMPWEIADHFDGSGYVVTYMKRFMSLAGGPRKRTFGAETELMKYPLMFWDDRCSFGVSIHQPTPFEENFGPIGGALLHFKFFADYAEKTRDAVADGQYFDGAREYQRILDAADEQGGLDFTGPVSKHYEGPQQLLEEGFMAPLWTDGKSGS